MKLTKKILALLLTLVLSLGMFTACAPIDSASSGDSQPAIAEDGSYTSKDEVALYIHTYGHLPENYITKDEAYDLGWKSEGTLDEVAPGMSIGGDYYGNYEGVLPDEPGREYHECDIDYESGNRNGKRIVYSNDGNIYYTEDHYNSFEHLYGDDE